MSFSPARFAGSGKWYSPFIHAPIFEELKVIIPFALKDALGLSNVSLFLSLGLAALIFTILHIFNEKRPQGKEERRDWFYRVFSVPIIVSSLGIAISFAFFSHPYYVATSFSMGAHLVVNLIAAAINVRRNKREAGIPFRKAFLQELRNPSSGPVGYANIDFIGTPGGAVRPRRRLRSSWQVIRCR